jgi:hypothetical protein
MNQWKRTNSINKELVDKVHLALPAGVSYIDVSTSSCMLLWVFWKNNKVQQISKIKMEQTWKQRNEGKNQQFVVYKHQVPSQLRPLEVILQYSF